MDSFQGNSKKLITLSEAAQILAVTIEELLQWNEYNILKPTITQTGEIGYLPEQINKFLTIQNVLNRANSPEQTLEVIQQTQSEIDTSATALNFLQPDYHSNAATDEETSVYMYRDTVIQSQIPTRSRHFPLWTLLPTFAIAIPMTVILFTQQDRAMLFLDQHQFNTNKNTASKESVAESQISKFSIQGTTAFALPIQLKNKNISTGSVNEDVNISETKLVTPNIFFEDRPGKNTTTNSNQTAFLLPELNDKVNNQVYNRAGHSDITDFASRATCLYCIQDSSSENNAVFDNNGNIKGETKSNGFLSTALGTTGVIQNENPLRSMTDQNILWPFLAFGLLIAGFVFRRQAAVSTNTINEANIIPASYFHNDVSQQKILELDQKTDGTIVLIYNGCEYKVSKPELDSESDQFISRLMELIPQKVKEIDYDILDDEKIKLNAPLSKLVTRLGFVGLKRDLFFPRTSKNRVLFRKFITQQDLASMGIGENQISIELMNAA